MRTWAQPLRWQVARVGEAFSAIWMQASDQNTPSGELTLRVCVSGFCGLSIPGARCLFDALLDRRPLCLYEHAWTFSHSAQWSVTATGQRRRATAVGTILALQSSTTEMNGTPGRREEANSAKGMMAMVLSQ